MAQQTINIGVSPNDGTGDPLRVGAEKINDNFTEVYTYLNTKFRIIRIQESELSGSGLLQQQVADAINNRPQFTIRRDEGVMFMLPAYSRGIGGGFYPGVSTVLYSTYYFLNFLGAGVYGAGGTQFNGISISSPLIIQQSGDVVDLGVIPTFISSTVNTSGPYREQI